MTSCGNTPSEFPFERNSFNIHNKDFVGQVRIAPSSKGFILSIQDTAGVESDRTIFPFQPYQLDTADVNRDGRTDILVGLIKDTRFDPGEKRRLFILQIDEGNLRPLWLGSRTCQQLINFRSVTKGIVATLEKTKAGNFAVGTYRWEGFGLALVKYIVDEKSYDEAVVHFRM